MRYADCRARAEAFAVRVTQGDKVQSFEFGLKPIVDELDPMKLLWDWSYAWDSVSCALEPETAVLEIVTTGPTGARRCLDCLCLTSDETYRPSGREQPPIASWTALAQMRRAGMPDVTPLVVGRTPGYPVKVGKPPSFLRNVGTQWEAEFEKPRSERIDTGFSVDPPLLSEFLSAFKGTRPAVYGDPSSGPVWHIPNYPKMFATGSPFLEWLARHPESRFAILLNYGEPQWPPGADRKAVYANLRKHHDQFAGFIAGENLADRSRAGPGGQAGGLLAHRPVRGVDDGRRSRVHGLGNHADSPRRRRAPRDALPGQVRVIGEGSGDRPDCLSGGPRLPVNRDGRCYDAQAVFCNGLGGVRGPPFIWRSARPRPRRSDRFPFRPRY